MLRAVAAAAWVAWAAWTTKSTVLRPGFPNTDSLTSGAPERRAAFLWAIAPRPEGNDEDGGRRVGGETSANGSSASE